MKWTTDPVTQVLAKLRDSAALQGVDFCRAYPDQMKPSRLLRPVVAVRLAEMDGTSDAVGEESRAGQIALRFDLYAPRYAPYGSTRVRQGENAFDIAARTGVSVDTIVALNRLASPFDLTPGEKVVLA